MQLELVQASHIVCGDLVLLTRTSTREGDFPIIAAKVTEVQQLADLGNGNVRIKTERSRSRSHVYSADSLVPVCRTSNPKEDVA